MKRREFIAGLGGAAVWPMMVRAQQRDLRRIGVLMAGDENDPVWKTFVSALTQALADLGWADGRNVGMDFRWAGGDSNRTISKTAPPSPAINSRRFICNPQLQPRFH